MMHVSIRDSGKDGVTVIDLCLLGADYSISHVPSNNCLHNVSNMSVEGYTFIDENTEYP